MKNTKSKLRQIVKEELNNFLKETEDMGSVAPAASVPPEVAAMEDLWDAVRGFYKAGRSDIALKLQKIAEMADEGHERLVPRGQGTPGV